MSIKANRTLKLSIADARHYKADLVTAGWYAGRDNTVIIFDSPVKMVSDIKSGAAVMDYAFGVKLKNGRVVHIFNPDFTVTLHNAQEKRI